MFLVLIGVYCLTFLSFFLVGLLLWIDYSVVFGVCGVWLFGVDLEAGDELSVSVVFEGLPVVDFGVSSFSRQFFDG